MIPFKSKTFQILKAINYDIPKPAIMQLREHVYPYAQYRDVKSTNLRPLLSAVLTLTFP